MRHGRCRSCSRRAACRNGTPPSLPMCRAMASSSIDADRFLLLSRHELVLASFLSERECTRGDGRRPKQDDQPTAWRGQAIAPTMDERLGIIRCMMWYLHSTKGFQIETIYPAW